MILFKLGCCSSLRRLSTRLSIHSIRRFSSTTTYKSVLSTVKPSFETVASLRSGSPSLPTWWHWRFFPVRDEAAGFNGGTIGRMNARAGVGLGQQVTWHAINLCTILASGPQRESEFAAWEAKGGMTCRGFV